MQTLHQSNCNVGLTWRHSRLTIIPCCIPAPPTIPAIKGFDSFVASFLLRSEKFGSVQAFDRADLRLNLKFQYSVVDYFQIFPLYHLLLRKAHLFCLLQGVLIDNTIGRIIHSHSKRASSAWSKVLCNA